VIKISCFQVSRAVEYLHNIGVAHRDIKLENILIADDLSVRLIDFGFSLKNCDDKTIASDWVGSRDYSPPETLFCIPYNPLKVDVWCLGLILFALLYANLPFDSVVMRDIHKNKTINWIPYQSHLENIPQDIRDILLFTIIYEPESRLSAKDIVYQMCLGEIHGA